MRRRGQDKTDDARLDLADRWMRASEDEGDFDWAQAEDRNSCAEAAADRALR